MSQQIVYDPDGTPVTWQFISLAGAIDQFATMVEDITPARADGYTYRDAKKKAAVSILRGVVDVADAATAHALITAYKGAQGTLVDIETDDGQTVADVMVLSVRKVGISKSANADGGISGGLWLVRSEWQVQATVFA